MLHPAQKIASFFVAKKLIPAQDYEWLCTDYNAGCWRQSFIRFCF